MSELAERLRRLADFAEATEDLTKQLEVDEGFMEKPYDDTEGFLTIGHGILLEHGISEFESRMLLLSRLLDSFGELNRAKPIVRQLSQKRVEALANMAFNLGVPRLLKFKKMWAAIEAGDFDEAAAQALDSKWATQVKGRADRIAALLRTG